MIGLDLGGTHWQVRPSGKSRTIPAVVPGCVHLDLMAAGKIPDPFVRDNELEVQWIGQTNWIYSSEFEIEDRLFDCRRVLLRCEGLDTLATIRINGKLVARTDNMFRTYEFDVKRLLRRGLNRIDIRLDSTYPCIRRKQAAPRPGNVSTNVNNPVAKSWVRKEPCNYGWDWGPVLVTCGIWRPIQLLGIDEGRITDVAIRQHHKKGGSVDLEVSAEAELATAGRYSAFVDVTLAGQEVASAVARFKNGSAKTTLSIPKPRLWFPNGMGEQPLYTVAVTLVDANDAVIDTTLRTIGLRTLRLVRKRDKWGQSFHFEINGVPFFAKGANWIPADAFAPRLTALDYDWLIASAAAANMNMLRVWGGGIYEPDIFYDLCDQHGICVWQDFVFACATYPTFDPDFMKSVRAEAIDNVRRLRHHPSIALWCGNNEIEMAGLVAPKWSGHQMSWKDYGRLFDELLPQVCAEHDPDRDYWPSSPHTPVGNRSQTNHPDSGDAHLWEVWHGRLPFEWYHTSTHRFCSEFGFQSFPEPRTIAAYAEPGERNVTSRVMEHHQRSDIGNTVIVQYMLSWFRMPKDFENLVWLSQALQGLAMKYGVEHWRRNRPRSMGAIYWQLNDCWPVASWASIDYFGRWKALHYMARRFFAPVLVSLVEDRDRGTVEVHVTSDLLERKQATLEWTVTDLDGSKVAGKRQQVIVAPARSHLLTKVNVAEVLKKHGAHNLIFWANLRLKGSDRTLDSSNVATFAPPKHLDLRPPRIGYKVFSPLRDGTFEVQLESKCPALYVRLELEDTDVQLSDNFFHLQPGQPATVYVTPHVQMSLQDLRSALRVRSLVDSYE